MLKKAIKGRLGNQMFQYAAMRAFQEKHFPNQKIALSFRWNKSHDYDNQLKELNATYQETKIHYTPVQYFLIFTISAVLLFERSIHKKSYVVKRERIEEKFKNTLLKHNIIWRTQGYTDFDLSKINPRKDVVFYGYFESPKYFYDIKDILKKDFTPSHAELPSNQKLYDEIRNSNSVCISIRRGDLITNKNLHATKFICDAAYFERAIKLMNSKIKNPKYIVFSDDVEWCRANLNFPKGTAFESGHDPVWEKLRLMYSCKNFIISNSTFSWWTSFLSDNQNKVVIAPKIWNKEHSESYKDIYEDDWLLV